VIGFNAYRVDGMITDQTQQEAYLKNRAGDIELIDPTEAAVLLTEEVRSLEISYSAYARIQSLSLNNFLPR